VKNPTLKLPAKARTTPIAVPAPSATRTARTALSACSRTRAERGWRAHSWHLIPTGAGTMQSGQMGLPQDEQETPVSTFGWFAQVTGAADLKSTLDTAFECSICTVLQEPAPGAA
jgi:hypothetical protein